MRKCIYGLVILVVLVIISSAHCKAQSEHAFEVYSFISHGSVKSDVIYYGETHFFQSKKVKLAYQALVESSVPEILAGFVYAPVPAVALGVLGGTEWRNHQSASFRLAVHGNLSLGRSSIELLWERGKGEDNTWHKNTFLYRLTPHFSFGVRDWAEHGTGLLCEYEIHKHVSFSVMPGYLTETDEYQHTIPRVIVGCTVRL